MAHARTQIIQVIRVFKVENLYYNNSLLAFNYFVFLIILDNLFIPYVSVWRYLSYLCSTTSIIHRETSGMNIWCWPQFHPSDMPSGKKCYFWYFDSFCLQTSYYMLCWPQCYYTRYKDKWDKFLPSGFRVYWKRKTNYNIWYYITFYWYWCNAVLWER